MKLRKQRILFPLFLLLLLGPHFRGPQNLFCLDEGFKYIENYTPKEYRGNPQNWVVLQDKRGVIYLGNQGGLLEYDGFTWRHIDVPHKNVRSLAMDDTGTIYIGGNTEFGYLSPDEKGSLQYVSLSKDLKDKQKNFSDIWKTYCTKEGIYFQANEVLFRWDSKQIREWRPDHRFHFSFVCGEDFFIKQDKIGIMKMVNDKLEVIPGGEIFADKRVYMMVPYDSGKLLIGTRESGLYIYDGKKAEAFQTDVDDYLLEKELYHGIRLVSSPEEAVEFALATLRGGLIIIDYRGRLKKIFTVAHGLRDDDVKYVFEDSQGNLWLGLTDGISKIEYNSPFSVYDRRSGLSGLVLSVVKHRNRLYAGTTNGLYFFLSSGSPESPGKFRIVPGITDSCWSLLSTGDSLLASTSSGVFNIDEKNKKNIKLIDNRSYFLIRSQKEKNRIWTATREGLFSLYFNAKSRQWTKEKGFGDINQEIKSIVENQNGDLWLGTTTKGIINVDFDDTITINSYRLKKYHTSDGLPPGEINVFWAADHVMFATGNGIFRFDKKKASIIPDSTLEKEFAGGKDGRGVFRIAEDKQKNIWFYSKGRNFQAVLQPNGTYDIRSKILRRLSLDQVNFIYPSPETDVVWFARHDGLIRFDPTIKKNCDHDFSTLIRRAIFNGKLVSDGSKHIFPVIPYEDRNFHVQFAAPFFEDESRTRFQYCLDGYENKWSPLTTEAHKGYPNLNSGLYTFRVEAINIYEKSAKEAVFRFKILTPWYKTWWAFLLYAAVFFLLTFFIIKWRHSIQLAKEKQRLEQTVKERTREIIDKNRQLEEQSEKLQEMDTAKSRFFANISHEFRTPLTLIMGPIEQMLSGCREKRQRERLNLVLRNSHRLLTLINQLLDLSRFDSGKMKLQAAEQNVIPFLKGILASFELVASQKRIALIYPTQEEDTPLYFDPEKLEEIFGNLLSNALKFTPAGGEITVTVKKIHAKKEGENLPPDFLDISVRDTGIGISKEQLAHIFDRFYQAKGFAGDRQPDDPKGTGIGLALAKELVNLHHGKIDVHSSEGKGTEFVVRLPMGKGHLKPDEIAEPSEITTNRKKYGEIPSQSIIGEEEEDEPTVETGEENGIDPETQDKDKNVILVVEDNADVREYIKGSLEPQYIVKEAPDGRQGISVAKDIIPDLIISDIMMPEIDGCELCKTLKSDIKTSHVPIILLTAKASEESIVQGLETGADDYITKPFNTTILCARIKNLIDLRRDIQQKIQRNMMLQPTEIQVSSMDETFIKEVQEAIEKNLSEPEFNVEQLGKKLYMSRATLYRKIQALTGESPRDFIRSYRLKRGAQLLKAHFGNVTEIAFEVGFSSTAYFTRCFKEKFHQLPHAYQAAEGR